MAEAIPDTATVSQLARLIGINREHVYKHIRRGGIKTVSRYRYPVREVLLAVKRHREEDKRNQTGPRTEKIRLETELLRIRLEQLQGTLLEASAVERTAFETARTARDLLLTLPDRLAAEVAGLTSIDACHASIRREVDRICAEISSNPTRRRPRRDEK